MPAMTIAASALPATSQPAAVPAFAGPAAGLPGGSGDILLAEAAADGADSFAMAMQMQEATTGQVEVSLTPAAPLSSPPMLATDVASPAAARQGKVAASPVPPGVAQDGPSAAVTALAPEGTEAPAAESAEAMSLPLEIAMPSEAALLPEQAPGSQAGSLPEVPGQPPAQPAPQSMPQPVVPVMSTAPAPERSTRPDAIAGGEKSPLSADASAALAPEMKLAPLNTDVAADSAQSGPDGFVRALDASASPAINPRDLPSASQPLTAPSAAPSPVPVVSARPGRIGAELGVAIARHVERDSGMETLTVRLDPPEHGRIEVALRFEEGGTLRAHVAASHAATLDLLRRESADLVRSLADAGISADAQSFRFEGGSENSARQQTMAQDQRGGRASGPDFADRDAWQGPPEEPAAYRPLSGGGRIDLMA